MIVEQGGEVERSTAGVEISALAEIPSSRDGPTIHTHGRDTEAEVGQKVKTGAINPDPLEVLGGVTITDKDFNSIFEQMTTLIIN